MAERIAYLVERLNMSPFHKGFNTMSEFDSKSSLELLEILCEVVSTIDPEQEKINKMAAEPRVKAVIAFLTVMKFNVPAEQVQDFEDALMQGDKDTLNSIMFWCLQNFDRLQKRAYLAKFLLPVDVPSEYQGDDLIVELNMKIKELQGDFKEVHKQVDHIRQTVGARPQELRNEITQLEQERVQLQNKVSRMKREVHSDDNYFQEMLKATSTLRKEQEEEMRIHDRLLEGRRALQEAELRFGDSSKRLTEMRSGGTQNQSADELFSKLQRDVRELQDRRETLEGAVVEREMHLEKLQSWENNDRATTEEDVLHKRDQVQDMDDQVKHLQGSLDASLERNTKLVVFRQASTMALKKLREKEDEMEKLLEEKRRIGKLQEEKEQELRASGKNTGKPGKADLKKYGAIVRDKVEKYKKMREELSSVRAELVVLQRTEQVLKTRHSNLDDFNAELEKAKGVEGYRGTQRALEDMAEKTNAIDETKGLTLEQISTMVEQISREFKAQQAKLQPLMASLKKTRIAFQDVEATYLDKKAVYDKVAVGLEMEKAALEKECDSFQDECMREESRFHYLNSLTSIARIKLDRAEQESKWQAGDGRLMRDIPHFKDLYANKLTQQEQLTKQLRKRQKELKENAGVMTNQKTNFLNLQALLDAKLDCENGGNRSVGGLTVAEAKTAEFM